MAITSGEVLIRVQKICKRGRTNTLSSISQELLEILLDLSRKGAFLKAATSDTLVGNADTITVPDDFAVIDYLFFTASVETYGEISFADYLNQTEQGVAERDGTLYVYPKSGSGRAYTLYYGKLHAESVAAIEFEEKFRAAINYGVAMKVYENYEQFGKAREMRALYNVEIDELKSDESEAPAVVQMKNLIIRN